MWTHKLVCLRKTFVSWVFLRCHVYWGIRLQWPLTSNIKPDHLESKLIVVPDLGENNQSFLRWNFHCQADLWPPNSLLLTQSGRGLRGPPAEFISQLSFFHVTQTVFQWRDETKWKSGNIFISKYRHEEVQVASRCYTGELSITSFHSYLWPLSKTPTCKSTRVLLQLWLVCVFYSFTTVNVWSSVQSLTETMMSHLLLLSNNRASSEKLALNHNHV